MQKIFIIYLNLQPPSPSRIHQIYSLVISVNLTVKETIYLFELRELELPLDAPSPCFCNTLEKFQKIPIMLKHKVLLNPIEC